MKKVAYPKESYEDAEKFIQIARSRRYPEIAHAFSELELKFIEKGINRCKRAAQKPVGATAICPMCEQVYYKDYPNQVFCRAKCRTDFAKHVTRFKTKMHQNAYLDIMNPEYNDEENKEEHLYATEDLENRLDEPFKRSADYYLVRAARKISRSSDNY